MKRIIDSTLVILSLMWIFGCKESKVVKLYLSLIQRTILLTQWWPEGNNFVLSLKVWIQKTDATSDKKIGNAVRSLFSFLLLSDAEVLEDIV